MDDLLPSVSLSLSLSLPLPLSLSLGLSLSLSFFVFAWFSVKSSGEHCGQDDKGGGDRGRARH